MVGRRHRFTALATAAVVLLAHLACVCPGAAATASDATTALPAAAADARDPAAHGCCKHETPAGRTDDRRPADDRPAGGHRHHDNCGHCAGADAVAAARQADERQLAAAGPALDPLAFVAGFQVTLVSPVADSADPADSFPPPVLSPPTLLGLRCALNL